VQQMERCLLAVRGGGGWSGPVGRAAGEAASAAMDVMKHARPIELTPQNAYIRRLQHELAQRYNVPSRSYGREPRRRVRLLPQDGGPFDG